MVYICYKLNENVTIDSLLADQFFFFTYEAELIKKLVREKKTQSL